MRDEENEWALIIQLSESIDLDGLASVSSITDLMVSR